MYLPQIDDERETLCRYLEVQLDALRASAHGLTDEQARSTPLRSALGISGIIKHCTWAMVQSLVGAGRRPAGPGTGMDGFATSFVPTAEEGIDVLLARFDEVRDEYLEMCRQGDPDAVLPVGPMPWYGMDEARPAALRYQYVHHVEEFARHAGHADILREQVDGAKAAELAAAVEGRPANPFVTPWQPR